MCSDPELSDKTQYPTFARTYSLIQRLTPSLLALLKEYKWKRVAILSEDSPQFKEPARYMISELAKNYVTVSLQEKTPVPSSYTHKKHSIKLNEIMRKVKSKARSK